MLEQFADGAAEQVAEGINGRHIHTRHRFLVQGRDGAAIQAGEARNVRDAKLVATHEGRQMTADHVEPAVTGCCAG